MSYATRAGFTGGLVVDYPNSKKAKKYYLCLLTGGSAPGKKQQLPAALGMDVDGEGPEQVAYEKRRIKEERAKRGKKKRGAEEKGDKDWILRKKSLYRQRGKEGVPNDSKFTGRKRRTKF